MSCSLLLRRKCHTLWRNRKKNNFFWKLFTLSSVFSKREKIVDIRASPFVFYTGVKSLKFSLHMHKNYYFFTRFGHEKKSKKNFSELGCHCSKFKKQNYLLSPCSPQLILTKYLAKISRRPENQKDWSK
jgi:hypothetical protein